MEVKHKYRVELKMSYHVFYTFQKLKSSMVFSGKPPLLGMLIKINHVDWCLGYEMAKFYRPHVVQEMNATSNEDQTMALTEM